MSAKQDKVRRGAAQSATQRRAHSLQRRTTRAPTPSPPPASTTPSTQRVILYPAYINSKRTVSEGRRIPADKGARAARAADSAFSFCSQI